jgi:hypothetical protein
VSYILGDIFTNSSGHPAPRHPFKMATFSLVPLADWFSMMAASMMSHTMLEGLLLDLTS